MPSVDLILRKYQIGEGVCSAMLSYFMSTAKIKCPSIEQLKGGRVYSALGPGTQSISVGKSRQGLEAAQVAV